MYTYMCLAVKWLNDFIALIHVLFFNYLIVPLDYLNLSIFDTVRLAIMGHSNISQTLFSAHLLPLFPYRNPFI